MFICVVYTQKSCTQLLCLNNAQHLCLNNMNLWNNIFCTDLERTHEAYKFVMLSIDVKKKIMINGIVLVRVALVNLSLHVACKGHENINNC
jgi:hypothetical protein